MSEIILLFLGKIPRCNNHLTVCFFPSPLFDIHRCAQGTPRPIFDRAFREAADEYNRNNGNGNNDDADSNNDKANIDPALHGVSEVGVGFRCIFGHMI